MNQPCPMCPKNPCLRKAAKTCYHSKQEGYPLRNAMCHQNYRYYESGEKRLADIVARNRYMEDRERRRGLRKKNQQSLETCPRGWHEKGGFCQGPAGYIGERRSKGIDFIHQ